MLKDPVDKTPVDEKKEPDMMGLDSLKIDDLKVIPQKFNRRAAPFDGYPVEKITIGHTEDKNDKRRKVPVLVGKHEIVILNPDVRVVQDPSNEGMTRLVRGEVEEFTIETTHSRRIYDAYGQALEAVFDREMKIEDKVFKFAIVPDHVARAQLMYRIVQRGRGKPTRQVDNRYKLLDIRQASRLRQCFDSFFNQQFKGEKFADLHENYRED